MPKTIPLKFLYPETDGKPMAENTLQFEYIVTIKGGLDARFADDADVFVAGDLFWYPVEGHPEIVQAPDVLVAFGRPKGHRPSYLQWLEGGIAPQTLFEIMSPGNRLAEMQKKFQFYERYGAEEYYIYDPDRGHLEGWLREGDKLREIASMHGWISPRLGIRFEMNAGELALYHPDGRRFLTYLELERQRAEDAKARVKEEQARKLADWERERAEKERERAEKERDQAAREKATAEAAAERLRAQLRALGANPAE
jgi:Uma2 family endonuclease